MNKQEAINALKEHNQEHVIKRLEALDEVSAKKLIAQVASIDWSVVESINHKAEDNSSDRKVEPLEAVEIKDIKANKDKYTAKGIEAIKAGKHVFCEKPIDHDIAKIKEVIDALEGTNLKYQVGFNRRFDHNFESLH